MQPKIWWLNILDTDSYKLSHWKQYPPNTTYMMSYLEARGGQYDATVFFGLQYILKAQLSKAGTFFTLGDLAGIEAFSLAHGLPFNRAGWQRIFDLGYFPVRIRAVPEGTRVPKKNVLMTVESTDPETFWIVSWLETLLSRLWYPQNVATLAYEIRSTIQQYLDKTSDDTAPDFKLHDFGSRGASSQESAAIASMAHLTSFKGTDTVAGLLYAAEYYNSPMAGFSIPASEHSTMTMWGKDGESRAYQNMVDSYGGDGRLYACVSDSWDLYNAVSNLWCGTLLNAVISKGGTLVIRPDSGDPSTVCLNVLRILDTKLGCAVNSKGYKELPSFVRVIYGDGINHDSIQTILSEMERAGYAASNVAFGMGGALVQKHCRDTHKMAFKCCAAEVDGKLVPVYKDPVTDSGKRSKSGLLDLWVDGGRYSTQAYTTRELHESWTNDSACPTALRTVFENGKLLVDESLDTIRERLWKSST